MENKRKAVIILCDGMSDYKNEKDCTTPMTNAKKPSMDFLASNAIVGMSKNVPDCLSPGSDVANLSVMGYNPEECYTGRSPLEAVSIGIDLNETSVTYRANLVSLTSHQHYEDKTMLDYSAGEITTKESTELIKYLAENLFTSPQLKLYTGISYRHCLVRDNGKTGAILTPPHDISDRAITNCLPKGEYASQLLTLMKQSYQLLKNHPINIKRQKEGKNTADSLWFWGEGTKPRLQNFQDKYGVKGAVISAVDLIKGIGICAGMTSINVSGASGTLHTNFSGKAQAAIKALATHDFVYIHLEAPDECGHQGDRAGKTKAIELIDEKIVNPIAQYLQSQKEAYSIAIIPDHATPTRLKTHTRDEVPFLLFRSGETHTGVSIFSEESCQDGIKIKGEALISMALKP